MSCQIKKWWVMVGRIITITFLVFPTLTYCIFWLIVSNIPPGSIYIYTYYIYLNIYIYQYYIIYISILYYIYIYICWHSIWYSFLAYVSGISSDILSGILSGIFSEILCGWGTLYSDPELTVEVRRGTLWSGACGGELAVEVLRRKEGEEAGQLT